MKTVIDAVNEFKAFWDPRDSVIVVNQNTTSISNWRTDEPIGLLATPEWSILCTRDEFNKCVEEMTNMNIKPVYTQVMCNTEQLPDAGMDCLCMFAGIESIQRTIRGFSGDEVWTTDIKAPYQSFICKVSEMVFKPLTPPVELIDGEAYQVTHSQGNKKVVYSKLHDVFHGSIDIINTKDCANIQLLEVKS